MSSTDAYGFRSLRGYDPVTIDTTVFQKGLPPHLIPAGGDASEGQRAAGEGIMVFTGPDGVQRPLYARLLFQRCTTCRGLVLDEDANAHTAWHAGVAQPK